ncbi:hypothetical protein CAT39_08595, partial [Acinetobacter baumannii]
GGGHLRVCWILWLQSANPLSFCHHNHLAVIGRNFMHIGVRSCVLILLNFWPLPKSLYLYRLNTL